MLPHVKSMEEIENSELRYQNLKLINHVTWYDRILLNRPLKVGIAFFLVAILSPALIYQYFFFVSMNLPPSDGFSIGSCLTPRLGRLACGNGSMTEEECHPQCCYDLNLNYCYHRLPSRFSYITNQRWNEEIILQPRIATVPYYFQNSIPKVRLSIDEISATHLAITFYNSRNASFSGRRIDEKEYSYEVTSPEVNIVVNASHRTIFNTARGPFIASDNIWEMAFMLTPDAMYGLGELPLKKNSSKIIYSHEGGINSIPLIFARYNNSYHGLLFDTSDPTEIYISPENDVVVRSITNFGFKFHLFVGPEPKNIMEDVMSMIGRYKKLEYWMLGVHVCSEVPGLDLGTFMTNATTERMPYDSHCGVEPIVFTSDQCQNNVINNITSVNNGAKLLRDAGKKFVPHVSPFIRHEEEKNMILEKINGYIKYNVSCKIMPSFETLMYRSPDSLEVYKGNITDYEVIYPNYELAPPELLESLWAYDKQVDGLVLENSWPLDKKEKKFNETIDLPYFNQNFKNAFKYTPQWNITMGDGGQRYLFQHNKYGNNFANAFANKWNETALWSSSLWMSGKDVINRQNIDASWANLHNEIINAALGGISGHWLWSSPICGDTENFNPETQTSLCMKWYLAAIFFPMTKIHSKIIPRHPTAFVGSHKSLAKEAISRRYALLPYYYTTLQEGPLLRPMFFQYPTSRALRDLSTQFNVGDSLLVAPNLLPLQSHVHVWKPEGTWYELLSGLELQGQEGDPITMSTAEADLMTFIKGGSVILTQRELEMTAEETLLLTPFHVIIALECVEEMNCTATGKQFVTDGLTLIFEANANNFTISAIGKDFDPICDINTGTWAYDIKYYSIYGLPDEMNNYDHHRQIDYFTDLCNLEYGDNIVINLLS